MKRGYVLLSSCWVCGIRTCVCGLYYLCQLLTGGLRARGLGFNWVAGQGAVAAPPQHGRQWFSSQLYVGCKMLVIMWAAASRVERCFLARQVGLISWPTIGLGGIFGYTQHVTSFQPFTVIVTFLWAVEVIRMAYTYTCCSRCVGRHLRNA